MPNSTQISTKVYSHVQIVISIQFFQDFVGQWHESLGFEHPWAELRQAGHSDIWVANWPVQSADEIFQVFSFTSNTKQV